MNKKQLVLVFSILELFYIQRITTNKQMKRMDCSVSLDSTCNGLIRERKKVILVQEKAGFIVDTAAMQR